MYSITWIKRSGGIAAVTTPVRYNALAIRTLLKRDRRPVRVWLNGELVA